MAPASLRSFCYVAQGPGRDIFAKVDRFSPAESPSVHWAIYFRVVGHEIQHLYERVREKATIVRQIDQDFKGYTEFEVADNNGHVLCFSEMN